MDKSMYERAASRGNIKANWQSSEHLKFWNDLLSKHSKFKDLPWGVGAWGTNYQSNSAPPTPLNTADRATFISEVTSAIEANQYPNIKAYVYFDSLYSLITPL